MNGALETAPCFFVMGEMMKRRVRNLCASILYAVTATAFAQSATLDGTLIVVPGQGQVKRANDQVRITWQLEEQDKNRADAASRVNLKMKQGMELLKKEDPQAVLKTRGYYTYPVYPEGRPRTNDSRQQPIGWRVGQYVEMTTRNLEDLPRTVSKAQTVLALNGLHFDLSDEAARELDRQVLEAAYSNLNERVNTISKVMGKNPAEARYEAIDFEGSGSYVPEARAYAAKAMNSADAGGVVEPSFEPGETTLSARVIGKIRFK